MKRQNVGFILLNTVVFAAIAITLTIAFVGWANASLRSSARFVKREQAFQIAEAGIDYYRWHLAHAGSDYQDGTGTAGPYTHTFYDKDGNNIGSYALTITPPIVGSTLVKIQSKATLASDPNASRTIIAHLAIPSFAKYAVVANDFMRIGAGTEVFGPFHSNNGIRFDGLAHNLVTSAVASYDDPDHDDSGTDPLEFGVHTHLKVPISSGTYTNAAPGEIAGNPVPVRTDVFMSGRQFPVAQTDFAGMTTDLSTIKTNATSGGYYYAASGVLGYHIVLKTNDTFDLYKVNSMAAVPSSSCTNTANQADWGTWSINPAGGGQTLQGNYPLPGNGLIFVEDNLWVNGQINTARVTIAAGKFPDNPTTRKSITINNDLSYTNYNGLDVIGLIAQNNVNVGLFSDTDLRIDAALIAQNGRVGRYYYPPKVASPNRCTTYDTRSVLTLYGMIATNIRYGFAYTDGTGYTTRNINYDANLLYGPPPSFPLTSDKYTTVFWQEQP